jgi:hypothetical protein
MVSNRQTLWRLIKMCQQRLVRVLFKELLDDRILNRLLANEGYSPTKRNWFPNNFFRAELLKAIKYPEISYRKFCTEEYLGLDRLFSLTRDI